MKFDGKSPNPTGVKMASHHYYLTTTIMVTALIMLPGAKLQTTELESTGEPNSTAEPEPMAMPSPPTMAAILGPPFVLMALIIGGLLCLVIQSCAHRRGLKRSIQNQYMAQPSFHLNNHVSPNDMYENAQKDAFLTRKDLNVINMMQANFNQPWQLTLIAWPALASLAFCPIVLFMYPYLISVFWPASFHPNGPPNINDAISCFLTPAGLVYATSFGFSYASALQKQKDLLSIVSHEISLLDQIMVMASQLVDVSNRTQSRIYYLVKDEVISIIGQIQGLASNANSDYKGRLSSGEIWKITPLLQDVQVEDSGLNSTLISEIISNMVKLSDTSAERYEIMVAKIHPLQWLFLETLGFFSFIGVLLIQAQSVVLQLGMCIMTVFSISILCYVVADTDSPFNGFFRVNLGVLVDLVHKAEDWYVRVLQSAHPITTKNSEKDPIMLENGDKRTTAWQEKEGIAVVISNMEAVKIP